MPREDATQDKRPQITRERFLRGVNGGGKAKSKMVTAGLRRFSPEEIETIRKAKKKSMWDSLVAVNKAAGRINHILSKTIPNLLKYKKSPLGTGRIIRLMSKGERARNEAEKKRRARNAESAEKNGEELVIPESIRKLFGG
jgi:hypothetical protein